VPAVEMLQPVRRTGILEPGSIPIGRGNSKLRQRRVDRKCETYGVVVQLSTVDPMPFSRKHTTAACAANNPQVTRLVRRASETRAMGAGRRLRTR
jgi:hypothetical protein